MENTPTNTPETSADKFQPEQAQQQQQPETGEGQSFETGSAEFGNAGDTQLDQRQDQETGLSERQPETGEGSFIGSDSDSDSSDQFVERDEQ